MPESICVKSSNRTVPGNLLPQRTISDTLSPGEGHFGTLADIADAGRKLPNLANKRNCRSLFDWIVPCMRLTDLLGAEIHLCGLGATSGLPQQGGVIRQALGHMGVLGSQGLFPDCQRSLVKRHGFRIAALGRCQTTAVSVELIKLRPRR